MATRTRHNFTFKCTLPALLSETAVSNWTTTFFPHLAKKKMTHVIRNKMHEKYKFDQKF